MVNGVLVNEFECNFEEKKTFYLLIVDDDCYFFIVFYLLTVARLSFYLKEESY